MITKEKIIDKIYSVIADKTLSLGCRVLVKGVISDDEYEEVQFSIRDEDECDEDVEIFLVRINSSYNKEELDIIGHPVMIGDILDYIEDKGEYNGEIGDTLALWILKRKPIENQSDKCIKYIYDLIK